MKDTPLITLTEKTAWIDARYWKFGHDAAFLESLEDVYEIDDDGLMTATPRRDTLTGETRGLMVLAATGNGKSATLLRALNTSHCLQRFLIGNGGNTLYIDVPPDATIKSLADDIAKATGYPGFDTRLSAPQRWEVARHRLVLSGISTVIIDECHHIFRAGPGRDIPGAIQALKHMMKPPHAVALIIAGVPELREHILKEPSRETYRRLDEFHLPRIQLGSGEATRFAQCLETCAEKVGIGLDPEIRMAERILFAEHGEVGRAVRLAKDTLHRAVKKRRTELCLSDAEYLFIKSNGHSQMTPFHAGDWSAVQADLNALGWSR